MSNVIVASSLVFACFLVLCMLVYYILNYKGMKAKKKYFEELHKNIKPGKNIEFCGGIYGKINKVNGDEVEISVLDGTKMNISRYAITQILD